MPNYIRQKTEKNEDFNHINGLDIRKLADLLSENLANTLSLSGSSLIKSNNTINFDESKTLDRLADKMSNVKSNNESNFKNLGNIVESKKDEIEVDNTINFLKNIDD